MAVTARCVLPILELISIIGRRAQLYRDAASRCKALHANEHAGTEYERWNFASELERLSGDLRKLAAVSIRRDDVEKAADAITSLADPIAPQTPTGPIAESVRRELRTLFVQFGRQNESILKGADESTNFLQRDLIKILGGSDINRRDLLAEQCKLRPKWDEQINSAERANATCIEALKQLQRAVEKSRNLPPENAFTHEVLLETLEEFAEINETIQGILREAIKENTEWCRRSVMREVAYASAGNDSEFDAAELLSGLVIARHNEDISRAEIADAVRHSLRAARPDGSWASDQPVYIQNHFVGVWPGTADLLVLLSTAVGSGHGQDHGPDVADLHLLRYVELLEARQRKKVPKWSKDKEEFWGFPSETREGFIDVWETAMSVRALVEIREVIEDRLWEICDDRFTIKHPQKGLAGLDPVDLGARHDRRLQTRLLRNAASTRHDDDGAEYAYVLHGPPGSSKTVIAEAIGREMWTRRAPRFVRITPADFTRSGEDGVDVEARFIFRLLSHVRRVTIFFDEIDDLLRQRKIDADLSFIRLVIPGMLNRLQDLRDAARQQEICFLLATNYVDQIEPALTRRGRIDAPIPVPYPDPWSRQSILERLIIRAKKKGKAGAGLPQNVRDAVVDKTADWPWSTYQKLCQEIIADRCRTIEEVTIKVAGFSAEFESADYYYWRVDRWKNTSPLVNEFVHFAFGASKLKHECRKRVTELESFLSKDGVPVDRLKLAERFDKAWDDTARG
ncbi:MAG: ATP-binding protein [Acidobacteriota bacterium]|nr:ATP-binding protein [Acidobacteriota bacterium]